MYIEEESARPPWSVMTEGLRLDCAVRRPQCGSGFAMEMVSFTKSSMPN